MSSQEFRDLVRVFMTTLDPVQHSQAIITLLDPLDLDIEYKKISKEGGFERVQSIFASFAEVEEDEMLTEYERKRLEQVGSLTDLYFAQRAYPSFALMIYQLLLESFMEKYDFGVESVGELHDEVLYEALPEEIQLQTFLLESMSNPSLFNWDRDEEVIIQSLLVLTVCFSDVYSFLTEDDDELEEVFED